MAAVVDDHTMLASTASAPHGVIDTSQVLPENCGFYDPAAYQRARISRMTDYNDWQREWESRLDTRYTPEEIRHELTLHGELITNTEQEATDIFLKLIICSRDRSGNKFERIYIQDSVDAEKYRLEHMSVNTGNETMRVTDRNSFVMPLYGEPRLAGTHHHPVYLGGQVNYPAHNITGGHSTIGLFQFQNNHETEIRKFVKFGLFDKGIKKFKALPLEKQIKEIKKMRSVKFFSEKIMAAELNLKKAGKYNVTIGVNPTARRNNFGKKDWANPFINEENHNICLGNMAETYSRCYKNANYLECLKIICAVLSTRHDGSGYRRWSDC